MPLINAYIVDEDKNIRANHRWFRAHMFLLCTRDALCSSTIWCKYWAPLPVKYTSTKGNREESGGNWRCSYPNDSSFLAIEPSDRMRVLGSCQ